MSGERRKDIAPVKGGAHRVAKTFFARRVQHTPCLLTRIDITEETIVRSDEIVLPSRHHYRATRGADSWIHHRQMNRARRKMMRASAERESRGCDVLCRNFVREINHPGGGIDREDDAFDRWNEVVSLAEVSE